MRIDLHCDNVEAAPGLQEYVVRRMRFAIGRFHDHIRWARVKVAEMPRLLQQVGWAPAAQKQGRRRFKHPSKPGRVPVPGKPSDDLAAGTKASHFEQAGLKT